MGRRPADTPPPLDDRPARRLGRRMRTRSFLALAGMATVLAGCSADLDGSDTSQIPGPDPDRVLPADALNPLGPVARSQDQLWDYAYPITIGVFAFVFIGLAFILFRFRDRGQQELPKQTHGNTLLEITWTLIPALILAVIAVPTVQKIFELQAEPTEDAVRVTAVGKQYWWEFTYTEHEFTTASELHIPTGEEVYIELDGTADGSDVIHSFWVPSLAGKRDIVPGSVRALRLEADEPGVYPGLCAEFCGLSHANMRFTVIAHSPADYEAWVAQMQSDVSLPEGFQPVYDAIAAAEEAEQAASQAETDEAEDAEALREEAVALREEADAAYAGAGEVVQGAIEVGGACVGCHAFQGHPDNAGSLFGPNLTHFAAREAFAGYIFDSPFGDQVEDPELAMERLRQWITDPQSLKPGAQMPGFGAGGDQQLTDAQIDAVIAYLATLE